MVQTLSALKDTYAQHALLPAHVRYWGKAAINCCKAYVRLMTRADNDGDWRKRNCAKPLIFVSSGNQSSRVPLADYTGLSVPGS
jgi:hypothetical protein